MITTLCKDCSEEPCRCAAWAEQEKTQGEATLDALVDMLRTASTKSEADGDPHWQTCANAAEEIEALRAAVNEQRALMAALVKAIEDFDEWFCGAIYPLSRQSARFGRKVFIAVRGALERAKTITKGGEQVKLAPIEDAEEKHVPAPTPATILPSMVGWAKERGLI